MPLISAHRGGTEGHTPGTRTAYERSIAAGAELVEFDVRTTRDGVYICHHDAMIPGLGLINEHTFSAVVSYAPNTATLAEVLELAAGRTVCHIDLKETGHEDAIVRLALRTVGRERTIVTSLEDASIAHIRKHYPDVPAALSLGRDTSGFPWPTAVRTRISEFVPFWRILRCRANGIAVNHRLATRPLLWFARRYGLKVMVWTINSDGLLLRFLSNPSVDVVVTDRPTAASTLRADLSSPSAVLAG